MKKGFSVIVASFVFLTVSLFGAKADEERLLKLIPVDAQSVLSVDITAVSSHPAFKKGMTESPEINALTKNTGLGPQNIGALTAWGDGESWVILTAWNKPFDPAKAFKAPDFLCGKTQINGKTVYNIVPNNLPAGQKSGTRGLKKNHTFWVALLPGNVVAFAKDSTAALRALKSSPAKSFRFPEKLEGTFRGVFSSESMGLGKSEFSCRMVGPMQRDLSAHLKLGTQSPQMAEQLRGQLLMMLNLVMIQTMQNEAELAGELMKQLKSGISGNDVTFDIVLPGALLERLGKFAGTQVKKQKARRSANKRPVQDGSSSTSEKK